MDFGTASLYNASVESDRELIEENMIYVIRVSVVNPESDDVIEQLMNELGDYEIFRLLRAKNFNLDEVETLLGESIDYLVNINIMRFVSSPSGYDDALKMAISMANFSSSDTSDYLVYSVSDNRGIYETIRQYLEEEHDY